MYELICVCECNVFELNQNQNNDTTANVAKSAQNCQNLLKFAQRQNFEIAPKIEILIFSKNKNLYV